MPSKEAVEEIIRSAPVARAYGPQHRHPAASTVLGRVWAVLLMVLGAGCVLLARQVYRLLPFLLGGGMVLAGVNRMVCGLWTREYRWKETKLTMYPGDGDGAAPPTGGIHSGRCSSVRGRSKPSPTSSSRSLAVAVEKGHGSRGGIMVTRSAITKMEGMAAQRAGRVIFLFSD